jgi:lysyl-tRNA synthetase class 2
MNRFESPWLGRLRSLFALGAAVLSAATLITALAPGFEGALNLDGGPGLALGRLLAVATAAVLMALAWGLWRGKRRALHLMVGMLVAGAAIGAADGASLVATGAELAAAAALLASRGAFARGGVPRAGWGAGIVVAAAALGLYAVAAAPALTGHGASGPWPSLADVGTWLAEGSWWLSSGSPQALALDALLIAMLVAGGALLRSLLRSAHEIVGHTAEEHARAAAIVNAYARDSLDPFALRTDKSFHFARGGLLAYRVVGETAVVAGDPIGPPGNATAILADFQRFAAGRGWEVVITGASGRNIDAYREFGYRAIRIGEEAIVDPRAFTLEGRPIRKVRQSVTRLCRRGWTVETAEAGALTHETIEEIAAVDRAWDASQPRLYGFAMTLGRLWGAAEDEHGVYALARDPDGHLRSFLRFARYRRGLSLDVMRRSGGEPNGVNEALVVSVLEYAREVDLPEVSLNFAGFAHVMAPGASVTGAHRVLRLALRTVHGRFQLERIVQFNDKFFPEWRPRYLVHEGGPGLPLGALRVLQAEAYVRPPRARHCDSRWQPLPLPVRSAPTTGATDHTAAGDAADPRDGELIAR